MISNISKGLEDLKKYFWLLNTKGVSNVYILVIIYVYFNFRIITNK